MISSLSRSEASARAAIACSRRRSRPTASSMAAAMNAVSAPGVFLAARHLARRGEETQHREGEARDEHGDGRRQREQEEEEG